MFYERESKKELISGVLTNKQTTITTTTKKERKGKKRTHERLEECGVVQLVTKKKLNRKKSAFFLTFVCGKESRFL